MSGKLYVIATPIGNLSEMPPRAVDALHSADFVAAEDTRVSAVLLNHFGIKKKIVSYHKFNESRMSESITNEILNGKNVALVSDAGTPCISDPGYILVRQAVLCGIDVVGVSGPCAAVLALSVSGIETDSFCFYGFFPKNKNDKVKKLKEIKTDTAKTTVFYESPLRIAETIALIGEVFPNAEICLCNDLTKKFEKIYRGGPAEVYAELIENPNAKKGEYTLVFNKNFVEESAPPLEEPSIEAMLVDIIVKKGVSLKEAVTLFHNEKKSVYTKKTIYEASLSVKNLLKQ